MEILSKEDMLKNKRKLVEQVRAGAVFIYPTDTIYGIGCDATNQEAVERVRELKQREGKPFSVIAPSVDWILANCEVSQKAKMWLLKLPGPYTLVLPLAKKAVAASANKGLNTLGVRIPEHWISSFAEACGVPLVTTSVNRSGFPPCTRLDQFKKFEVDFILYEGDKEGRPSRVVDLTRNGRVLRE